MTPQWLRSGCPKKFKLLKYDLFCKSVFCEKEDQNLTECRDAKSWSTIHNAGVIRKYKAILDVAVDENGFPQILVKYHRSCKADFTHKKRLQDRSTSSDSRTSSEKQIRKSTRNVSQGNSSIIEPDRCIFLQKDEIQSKIKDEREVDT